MLEGVTLKYMGGKALEFTAEPNLTATERLRSGWQNIGALVMRIQLGQAQRAALLQSIVREDYEANPVERAAAGGNEPDLFKPAKTDSPTRRATRDLEKFAHYTLGRGKLLNERVQPQKERNTELSGEEYLWDALHSTVWSIGLNLARQLQEQGFIYLVHPQNISQMQYQSISEELRLGQFKKIQTEEETLIIRTDSGVELNTAKFTDLEISMDPEHRISTQDNAFIVSYHEISAPIGWTIHSGTKDQLIDPQYTEDLLRIICIAKGGSYKLTKEEYYLLLEHTRARTDGVRFTQNRTLNLLDDVVAVFERNYQFDSFKLLGKSIETSYRTIQKRAAETEAVDDLLTGILITEMVQPLKITQAYSSRNALPHEFNNAFDITLNSTKAFAYSFDLKKPDGSLVLKTSDTPITASSGELIDVRVNGELQEPCLTNPKHVAALIATGVLVAEQLLLEQLVRDTCVHGDRHPHAVALKAILNNEPAYAGIIALAQSLPSDKHGPILGLQLPACDALIQLLRTSLGFDHLVTIARELYEANGHTSLSEAVKNDALRVLFQIGLTLQNLERTSGISQVSQGINVGIIPVIARIAPNLHSELVKTHGLIPAPDKACAPMKLTPATSASSENAFNHHRGPISACPFFNKSASRSSPAPKRALSTTNPESVFSSSKNEHGFFDKLESLTPYKVAAIGLTALAAGTICYLRAAKQ